MAAQPSETYKIGAVALRPGITASLPLSTDTFKSSVKEPSILFYLKYTLFSAKMQMPETEKVVTLQNKISPTLIWGFQYVVPLAEGCFLKKNY